MIHLLLIAGIALLLRSWASLIGGDDDFPLSFLGGVACLLAWWQS
jgi:hypothetical protein